MISVGIKKVPLIVVLSCLCTGALFAANGETPSQTKFRLQDLLPRSMQTAPRINLNVITEMTDEGKKLSPVSVEHPAYYVGSDGGYMEQGDSIAGERLPNAPMLAKTLQNALAQSGYLGADPSHPPTIFIFYRWGSFNAYHDTLNSDGTTDDLQLKNLMARVALVGGTKFANDVVTALQTGTLESFRNSSRLNDGLLNESFGDLYFMVAFAYDFEALKKGEKKLLWKTKISTNSQGLEMDETLPTLVGGSAQYFGHEMSGPVQLFPRLHEGKVEIGTATVQEYAAPAPSEPKPKP